MTAGKDDFHDEMNEYADNWVPEYPAERKGTKQESVTSYFLVASLAFIMLDLLSLFSKQIRIYHFSDFPNMHLIGVVILISVTLMRFIKADSDYEIDPYLEASSQWRSRKDMASPYDYQSMRFLNRKYNLIFILVSLVSFGLILVQVVFAFA